MTYDPVTAAVRARLAGRDSLADEIEIDAERDQLAGPEPAAGPEVAGRADLGRSTRHDPAPAPPRWADALPYTITT